MSTPVELVVRRLMHLLRPAIVVAGMTSCAAVAGIDEAKVDPSLTRDSARGGSVGTSTNAAGSVDPVCREYCDLMLGFCAEPGYQQFESDGVCMAFCGKLPRGSETDTLVNSQWCRLKQARLAKTAGSDAEPNCQAAGPGSDGTCGSKCATYCRLMREICLDNFKLNYADDAACLGECLSLTEPGPYDAIPAHDEKRKSVNCRIYHLTAASVQELSSLHCPHPVGAMSACTL